MKRRIIGTLVCLALLLGFVPGMAATARADGVTVTHDADEIQALLRSDGDVAIQLDADAEKMLTAYSDFEDSETGKWNGCYVWTKLGSGSKTIDLNGHRLYIYDRSARSLASTEVTHFKYFQKALLMEIPSGASLTVNDSGDGGLIRMDAEMPEKTELEGHGMIMERNIFAVTGGDLTVNGGEIHAGRSNDIYAQNAGAYDEDYHLIVDYTIGDFNFYKNIYGYATWFLSGTAITAASGSVTINGGDIWGRGWDNWTLISRVPGAPDGADDFRDRCAALRVMGGNVTVSAGSFHGRSDADAVQVRDPADLTVDAGTFDVGTNSWLVVPGVDLGGVTDAINNIFFHDSVFDVHKGSVGSFGVPQECIADQAVTVVRGNAMTIYQNEIPPYKIIDEANIFINSPIAGNERAESVGEVYGVPEGCTVQSVTWYQNGNEWINAGSGSPLIFRAGDSYSVQIVLKANTSGGVKFKNKLTDVSINGKEAEVLREGDYAALTVDFGSCPTALTSVALEVEEPMEEAYPSSWVGTAGNGYYAEGGYSNWMEYRRWFVSDNGESDWTRMEGEDSFIAGKYYRMEIEIRAGEGQQFAVDAGGVSVMPDITATVNGRNATVSKTYEQDPGEHVTVTCDFGKCPVSVRWVELAVTAPKDGATIRFDAASQTEGTAVLTDGDYNGTFMRWYQSDNGYDGWTEMSRYSTFTAGKYYKFRADVWAKGDRVFPTYDDGVSIQPNISAVVNGYGASVFKMYEQEPSKYVTVEYFFGYCNSSVVNNITILNVTPPVAGAKPSYVYSIDGNGYSMDSSRNAYYDDWQHGRQLYYVRNGLQWWDTSTGSWDYVYENDSFIPGHTYVCQLYLIAEDGFNFRNMSTHGALPAATVNGNAAEINEGWTNATEARIFCEFTCAAREVSEISLTGLTAPQKGETPDTEVASAEPDAYVVQSMRWLDVEDNEVNEFAEGQYYTAEIVVASAKNNGVDFCTFADPAAFIDGVEVTGWSNSVTTNIDNTVTIRYAFHKPAYAPAIEEFIPILSADIAVAAPVKGEAPQQQIAETDEYTGTVSWSGSPAAFEPGTVYTASVTLTAKAGYAFSVYAAAEVAEADSIIHKAVSQDGGTLSFDAVFPATENDAPAFTGLVELDGEWIYVSEGNKDASFTGLVENEYGWWYVVNGTLSFDYTGLVSNEYGWWYVRDSRLDFGYTGLVENEYGWWYVIDGRLGFDYTGLVENEYGWWYVRDSRLDFGYTGLVENEYGWWYVIDGHLGFDYTGLVNNEYGWWYVRDSRLDFGYTGLVENEYGWWYVRDSRLDFGYTGSVTNEYGSWNVVNGQVVF